MTPELVQVERKWRVNMFQSGCFFLTRSIFFWDFFISSIKVCGTYKALGHAQKRLKFSTKIDRGMYENVVKKSATACFSN